MLFEGHRLVSEEQTIESPETDGRGDGRGGMRKKGEEGMREAVMVLLLFKCFFTCAHVGQLMVVTMIRNYGAMVILLLHLLLQHASKLFLDYV